MRCRMHISVVIYSQFPPETGDGRFVMFHVGKGFRKDNL